MSEKQNEEVERIRLSYSRDELRRTDVSLSLARLMRDGAVESLNYEDMRIDGMTYDGVEIEIHERDIAYFDEKGRPVYE
jgi:hypothetical protein